jgi:hypothetical protein
MATKPDVATMSRRLAAISRRRMSARGSPVLIAMNSVRGASGAGRRAAQRLDEPSMEFPRRRGLAFEVEDQALAAGCLGAIAHATAPAAAAASRVSAASERFPTLGR